MLDAKLCSPLGLHIDQVMEVISKTRGAATVKSGPEGRLGNRQTPG